MKQNRYFTIFNTLISETKHIISKAIHDLSQLNVNDVLVNALGAKFHEIDNSIIDETFEVPNNLTISAIFAALP